MAVTWNPSDSSGTPTFSNGNLTITGGGTYGYSRSTVAKSGKIYFEVTIGNIGGAPTLGVSNSGALGAYGGDTTTSISIYSNGSVGFNDTYSNTGSTYTTGSVVGIAWDRTANLFWYRVGAGNWNNNGSANPATGAGGFSYALAAGDTYALVWGGAPGVITANFGATAYANAAPGGFLSLEASAIVGTLSVTEAADTLASAGALPVVGTLSATEAPDTLASAAKLAIVGTLAATEAPDTLASTGVGTPIVGTLAVTEAPDTLASAAKLAIVGTLAATEAPDTLAAAGFLPIVASLAVTEAADTSASAGALPIVGTLARTEAPDTLASAGALPIVGSLAATEAPDTLASAGGATPLTGTLAATEAPDTLAAAAKLALAASLAKTEAADTLASAAKLALAASLAKTEAADTLAAAGTHATTYFVATGGSDAANGLTAGTAWATIAKVNATSFNAGDVVQFNGGQTFAGTLTPASSGASGSPVTFTSYGTGKATINGAAGDLAVYILNRSYLRFSNLVLVGDNAGYGVYAENNQAGNTKLPGIEFLGVEISAFSNGVTIWGSNGTSGFSGLTFDGCLIHNNSNQGLFTAGNGGNGTYSHANVSVLNSKIYDNAYDGVILGFVDGGLIEFCEAYGNGGSDANLDGGSVGLWTYQSRSVVLQHNESHHNLTLNKDGGGLDIDGGCVDCTMRWNYSHDNEGPGFLICTYAGSGNTTNARVYGNISENDGLKSNSNGSIAVFAASGATVQAYVYNNTVFSNGTLPLLITFGASTSDRTGFFANNILYASSSANLVYAFPAPTGTSFRGNDYYGSGGIDWGGTTHATVAAWRSATGQETESAADTSKISNPLLVDPGNGGTLGGWFPASLGEYQLQPGSPMANGGVDINTLFSIPKPTLDFYGTTTVGLDIGASAAADLTATLAVTEAADTLVAAGFLPIVGSLAKTEAADTLTSAGFLPILGSLAATEADDTLAAAGVLPIVGSLAVTEAADTFAAVGALSIAGSLAVTEAVDTLAAAGFLPIVGAGAATEDDDTLIAAGFLPIVGSLTATEVADTTTSSVVLPIVGSLAVTEGADTLAAAGVLLIVASLTATEVADTLAAAGIATPPGATLAVTEADDTLAAAGALSIAGSLTVTEADDTVASTAATGGSDTPAERRVAVDLEMRLVLADAETRAAVVDAETRAAVVDAETRAVVVDTEQRAA